MGEGEREKERMNEEGGKGERWEQARKRYLEVFMFYVLVKAWGLSIMNIDSHMLMTTFFP